MERIKLARRGLILSHLCFADDLLLFCVATEKHAMVKEIIFQKFYHVSCLKVNTEKLQLVFSSNVDTRISAWLSSHFGIAISQEFGLYLGMTLFFGGEGEEKT